MNRPDKRILLSYPHMSGDELRYIEDAFRSNWIAPLGPHVDAFEKETAQYAGVKYSLATSSGSAALHLALKLFGVGEGDTVFCSTLTFIASVAPAIYQKAVPVFIDSDEETWNMSPQALEKAFDDAKKAHKMPKAVIVAELYGQPPKIDEICEICKSCNVPVLEDAAEALGTTYKGKKCGSFGDIGVFSYNGNKIITTSGGGMLLSDNESYVKKARFWATQARDAAPWYEHTEIGYNYRMSNVIAAVVRGQFPYLKEHIAQKKAIYMRYKDGLKDLPLTMNPYIEGVMEPNFWLSCLLVDKEGMCKQVRSDKMALYIKHPGKSCPTEIFEQLMSHNAQCRPIWKPMHLQPIFRMNPFVTVEGDGRGRSNAYISESCAVDVGADVFERGLCLPSDNKMTAEEQGRIIQLIRRCFS